MLPKFENQFHENSRKQIIKIHISFATDDSK